MFFAVENNEIKMRFFNPPGDDIKAGVKAIFKTDIHLYNQTTDEDHADTVNVVNQSSEDPNGNPSHNTLELDELSLALKALSPSGELLKTWPLVLVDLSEGNDA